MCSSLSNPTVASATSAAMGVLTPMPCVPVPAGPWLNPVPKVSIGGQSAISNDSKLMCAWGGQIAGQADKAGCAGSDALHGLDAGIKFLHIDAW